ncbi:FISUMP domain-containing protein [Fibrobacter succinogenes]|uniref:FISUMP domain-containing protein n=1 Tax=Fibrobacter succinogenes TaxID=833 RepID=UPI00156A610B|nr:FISUMP domain-containing protein [Fibrobacter succinogenes]
MNYSKISGQSVCKMAMLLAFVFAACSENNGPVAGGTVEETGLEKISLIGRAMRLSPADKDKVFGGWSSTAKMGSIIRMAELDSVTFDTTGVVYYTECVNSSGEFSFDSVSLNSPYVMFELAPYAENPVYWSWNGVWSFDDYNASEGVYVATYSVIVDVRETRDIDINAMTYLESARILSLVKRGKRFAEAKRQADKELLDDLGMYGDSFDFDKTSYVENKNHLFVLDYIEEMLFQWSEKNSTLLITQAFANMGSLSAVDSIKQFLVEKIYWMKNSEEFSDSVKNVLYNIVAGMHGLGRCTAQNEGKGVEVFGNPDRYMNVYCLSGQWTVLNGRYKMAEIVPTTIGTLVDSRDGMVYKTVTFDIDGLPQTWMAENLRYRDENVQPMNYFDPHYVSLRQKSRNFDFLEYVASLDSAYWNTVSVYKEPELVGYDSLKVEGEHFRGICPEGWHVPTLKEWSRLLYLLEQATGGCANYGCSDDFVENEYLGYHASKYLPQVGFGDYSYESFAFVVQSTDRWELKAIEMAGWNVEVMYGWDTYLWPYGYFSFRCVQD